MGGHILVALKSDDRLEQFLPYIETIAQPGVTLVYLIRYPRIGGFKLVQDRWMGEEVLEDSTSAQTSISEQDSLEEEQIRLNQVKVFIAQEALRKKGIEIVVDVYKGRLKKVIERYMRKGGVKFILMRAQGALRNTGFSPWRLSLFRFFKEPILSPVLLIYPDTLV